MIPIFSTKRQDEDIKDEILKTINDVCGESHFVLGNNVKLFENNFARYCGKKYCISVNSGTDALSISLKALGVKKGDEVITVSNSFISTALAINYNGAKPVFVDIDKNTYNIDTNKIRKKITKKTKVILPVHLYGQPANIEEIIEISNEYNLKILEDCCQAHGAEFNGKIVPISETGCFSFYPPKNLGAYGDGGCIVTDNEKVADMAKKLRSYGEVKKYRYEVKGFNSRLDEIQAAILDVKLKYLDKWNSIRRKNARLYNSLLSDIVVVPYEKKNSKHVYYTYTIRCKDRDNLQKRLSLNNIITQIYYPIPIHKQKSHREHIKDKLPLTEQYSKEILSLPMFPGLREDEIYFICEKIKGFYK